MDLHLDTKHKILAVILVSVISYSIYLNWRSSYELNKCWVEGEGRLMELKTQRNSSDVGKIVFKHESITYSNWVRISSIDDYWIGRKVDIIFACSDPSMVSLKDT